MLSEQEKTRIEAEEIFRLEVRESLEKQSNQLQAGLKVNRCYAKYPTIFPGSIDYFNLNSDLFTYSYHIVSQGL